MTADVGEAFPGSMLARVRDAERRVMALCGWRAWGLAAGAGAVSVQAMAPLHALPLLFITIPVLVWLLDAAAKRPLPLRAAAAIGWWFGFGYHLLGLYWIGWAFLVEPDKFAALLPFAVTAMPAGLALFWAVASAAAVWAWRPGPSRLITLALALALAEWLRGHILTGFPWNVLGYALTGPDVFMQSAGVVGIYGLTLILVLVAAAPVILARDCPTRPWLGVAASAATLVAMALYGAVVLSRPGPDPVPGVKLRLVQPSIPQRDKWRAERQREFFYDHLRLSMQAPGGRRDDHAGITHLIWAEAAMPFLPLDSREALDLISGMLGERATLLAGVLRLERDAADPQRRRGYNSLVAFGPGARTLAVYDKIHLVPFGEYLPFQDTLESLGLEQLSRLRGGFDIGPAPRPLLRVPGLPPLSVLICYEAIFPGAVVQGAERPAAILNVTNDGWFGISTGPYQHLHQTRVRAVEEGLPVIRVANNGITAVIDHRGRVLMQLGLDEIGTLDSVLPGSGEITLYAWAPDLLFWLLCTFSFTLLVAIRLRVRHSRFPSR